MAHGKRSNLPLHQRAKPRFWTAKWAARSGPSWSPTALMLIVSISSVGSGGDLALDRTTGNEIFAYANLLGTHEWGMLQSVGGLLVILMIATRWQAGLIVALGLLMTVWGMYSVVLLQGLWPILPEEGGLRSFIAAAEETTIILVAFVISVWQYRRGAVDEVTRSDGGSQ
ncbi:UNVERIFIED_CONTAM: hypothetical protein IGO34_22875 [Salmonella enterica subsp. enterica serovar Weltevreden]